MKALFVIAATCTVLAANSAIAAGDFTGNWPLTVTDSQRTNGTYCLEVKNGGLAYLEIYGGQAFSTYRILGGSIVVTTELQGGERGEGGNTGLVFVAKAKEGKLGNGVYDGVSDGESDDTGKVSFGVKGGC
jgi:hypothetical protein